jgi:hypothetical protein
MTPTVWKTNKDQGWTGTKDRTNFKIIKKSIGRNQFTYHGYFKEIYIASGKTLEECQKNVDLHIRIHG